MGSISRGAMILVSLHLITDAWTVARVSTPLNTLSLVDRGAYSIGPEFPLAYLAM